MRGELTSYQVIVAAKTGELLYRQSQVDNIADNPTWLAPQHSMPYNNLNAFPWNYPTTDNRVVHCWTATAGCAVVVGDNPATTVYPFGVASKFPWDVQLNSAGTDLGTTATVGNNVDDARLWSGNRGPAATAYGNPALVRATSATRDYQPAFTDAWYTSGCDPNNVNAAINPLGNDIEASTVSLFVGHNVMHDFAYYLGFDEGHWNAQQYNNGVTVNDPSPTPGGPTIAAPLANDGLIGNAQAGAATGSRDNANMNTGADGNHPTTNQFVWQPLAASFYAPCVDGAYDFAVFGHEFGHLIENRMIGKGVGSRQGTHAGSMGEAFGDFDALAAFNELHLPVPAGADRYTEGAYATGNGYNGIRDFLAGRPMGGEFPEPGKNPDTDPLNYGDFGFDNVGVEVHADGELWVAVQMDLRDLFLSRNPSPGEATDVACAHGQIVPTACPGDRQWIQDYYDAMVMMPRNTTMIQARDAMLAADVARFGGANQDLLWQGFAMRGFGQFQNTVSNGDSNPVPDFSSPLADNTTVNFFADTTDGTLPVNAKIYVGDYEARATQIADTDAATVNAGTPATGNLDNTAQFAPTSPESLVGNTGKRWSAYNFTAVAPGYGFVRFSMKFLKPGQTRNVTIHFAKNYASAAQGATIVGDALGTNTNLGNLIDDTEATNNGQTGAPVGGRWVVVKLGTTKAVPIDEPRRFGAARARQQPVHRASFVRGLRLHGGQAGESDVRRLGCRGLDADRQLAGQRVPVGQPASGYPRRDAPVLQCAGSTAGDARQVRRRREPVHRPAVLRRRPGQRPEQQRRLPRPPPARTRCTRTSCRSSARRRTWSTRRGSDNGRAAIGRLGGPVRTGPPASCVESASAGTTATCAAFAARRRTRRWPASRPQPLRLPRRPRSRRRRPGRCSDSRRVTRRRCGSRTAGAGASRT